MKEQGAAPTENRETSEWQSFLYGQKKKKKLHKPTRIVKENP